MVKHARKVKLNKQTKNIDKKLLIVSLVLVFLGLIAVADASAPQALNVFGDKFYFVKQQALWGLIGLVALLAATKIHYQFWSKIAIFLFILSILGLIVVLLPGVATVTLGAKRWIIAGPLSIQPSEFVKLTLAVYLAKVASKDKTLAAYFLPLVLVAFLIMLQPDLGTAVVIAFFSMVQIFASGISLLVFTGAGALGVIASLILIFTSNYRRDRLLTFFEQSQDPLGRAYHIRQILLALGSGGLFGVGLGQSRQKFLFLPEAATDSIFAIIAEEVGFAGATVIIFLFGYFVFRGFKAVVNAPDKFSQILALGIVAWIGGQALLNIGAMVALIPLTGIPLPFFSYGGSSLVMVMLATGILLNISKYAKKD